MKVERVGRIKHDLFGQCVRVKLRHWQGPVRAGDKGREIWTDCLIPKDQAGIQKHPRHLTAFQPVNLDREFRSSDLLSCLCISPSVSYLNELVRYAEPRWKRAPTEDTNEGETVVNRIAAKETSEDAFIKCATDEATHDLVEIEYWMKGSDAERLTLLRRFTVIRREEPESSEPQAR